MSHAVVSERIGLTNRYVLSRSQSFLNGIKSSVVPANYEPLGASVRLYAVKRRKTMKLKDEDSTRSRP